MAIKLAKWNDELGVVVYEKSTPKKFAQDMIAHGIEATVESWDELGSYDDVIDYLTDKEIELIEDQLDKLRTRLFKLLRQPTF